MPLTLLYLMGAAHIATLVILIIIVLRQGNFVTLEEFRRHQTQWEKEDRSQNERIERVVSSFEKTTRDLSEKISSIDGYIKGQAVAKQQPNQ